MRAWRRYDHARGDVPEWIDLTVHDLARWATINDDPILLTVIDRWLFELTKPEIVARDAVRRYAEEKRRPHQKAAIATNEKKPENYRRRNVNLLEFYEAVVREQLKAMHSRRAASAEAYGRVAIKANVTVRRAREIIAEARHERLSAASR
jgi:hypothetical protein